MSARDEVLEVARECETMFRNNYDGSFITARVSARAARIIAVALRMALGAAWLADALSDDPTSTSAAPLGGDQ